MKTRMLVISLIAFIAVSGYWLYRSNKKNQSLSGNMLSGEVIKLPDYSGIQVKEVFIKDIRLGKGRMVNDSSTVTVSYEGWIYDPASLGNKGKLIFPKEKFKSVILNMKSDQVLIGFKKGLLAMKAGGIRQLVIPDQLAYGDKGLDSTVPPKAILLFEIELMNVD